MSPIPAQLLEADVAAAGTLGEGHAFASVVALHDLINNKRAMKEAEQAADAAAAAKANPKKEKEGPETGKDKEEDKENAKAKK